MCLISSPSSDNGQAAAEQAATQQQEQQREDRITQGKNDITNVFSQYTPDYYSGLSKNYTDYYDPQLQNQYQQASQKELFNAANQGDVNSSGYANQQAQLQKQLGVQQQQINSAADSYANNAKSQVAALQNNTTQQLEASGDNTGINSTLLNQIQIQPASSLSPLANVFAGLVNTTAQIGANTAAKNGTILASPFFNQNTPTNTSGSQSKWVS